MTDEVLEEAKSLLGDAIVEESEAFGDSTISIEAGKWKSAAAKLKEKGYAFLADLCGVDHLGREPRFEVVYQLTDMENHNRLRVKVALADSDSPSLPSVAGIWPTADWFEREAFDMYGIRFEGHHNLVRILMPDEWEGHPLRKDYAVGKVPIEYKHLSPGY